MWINLHNTSKILYNNYSKGKLLSTDNIIYPVQGGQWMLNLVDHFGGTFLIFVLAIFELVGVFWIYGLENFCDDVEFMLNRRPGIYWRVCWGFVTPVFMLVIFIYSAVTYQKLLYGGSQYPMAAYGEFRGSDEESRFVQMIKKFVFSAAGWILLAIGVVLVPLWAIYIMDFKSNVYSSVRNATIPKDNWGPKSPALKREWLKFKADLRETRAAANKISKGGFWRIC